MRTNSLFLPIEVAMVVAGANEEAMRERYHQWPSGESPSPHRENVAARVLGRFVGELAWMQFDNAGWLRA